MTANKKICSKTKYTKVKFLGPRGPLLERSIPSARPSNLPSATIFHLFSSSFFPVTPVHPSHPAWWPPHHPGCCCHCHCRCSCQRRCWHFANDHLNGLAFCKSSSKWAGLLQMIIRIGQTFSPFPPKNVINFFFFKFKDQGSILRTFLEQFVPVF